MAKFSYDVSGEEHEARKPIEIPERRVYLLKVKACDFEQPKDKDSRLVVQYQIAEDGSPSYGYVMWEYINLVQKNVKWKLDEFLMAMGVDTARKESGQADTTKFVGSYCKGRIVHENDNDGNPRGRVRSVFPLPAGEEVVGGRGSQPDDEEIILDPVAEDTTTDEPGDDEIDWDALGAAGDEGDAEAIEQLTGFAEAAELDPDEYPTWAELAEALKTIGDGGDDTPDPEGPYGNAGDDVPEGEAGDDYDSWSVNDLKAELESRELATTGPKSALVARLRDNDADPF